MSTEKKQSAIKEVRDQLSLDYADGKYLNIVGSNLGLTRPRIGFTDASWRAVVKAIALHYKQIRTKFEEVLAIFFGPRITVDSCLAADATTGQTVVTIVDHSDWPQLGTIVFDEGLATEETLTYCLIDRHTHEVFLDAPLAFDHIAALKDTEQTLIGLDETTLTKVIVSDISAFPDPVSVGDYTIVIGSGTSGEETAVVTAIDYTNRVLTLSSALSNVHTVAFPSVLKSKIGRTINPPHPVSGVIQEQGVALLTVVNSTQFPPSGNILLSASGPGRSGQSPREDLFTATGGSTTTIDTAVGTFESGAHSGSRVVFDDTTTTAALQGIEATILTNVGNQLVIAETLPAAVVNTDTFKIRANLRYTSVDYTNHTLTLAKHIPDLMIESGGLLVSDTVGVGATTTILPVVTGGFVVNQFRGLRVLVGGEETMVVSNTAGSITVLPALPVAPVSTTSVQILLDAEIEILEPLIKWNSTGETVDLGQVKSPGTGWDVIQSNPRCVEILTPDSVQDVVDIRSASYLHTTEIVPTPTTTLTVDLVASGAEFIVTDPTDFPVVGVVTINGENISYHNLQTHLIASAVSGDTTIAVPDSQSWLPGARNITLSPGLTNEEVIGFVSIDATTNIITLSGALSNDHRINSVVRDHKCRIPNDPSIALHVSGSVVDLYQPSYVPNAPATSRNLNGNLWLVDDVFPGPYIYNSGEFTWSGFNSKQVRTAPGFGIANTQVTSIVPGPVSLAIDQVFNNSAIEVVDATALATLSLPFILKTGIATGNQEDLQVFDVNLRQRATTTVQTLSSIGDMVLEVVETQGVGVGDSIPVARGYRLLVDKGTAEEEVVYVLDITPQVNPLPDLVSLEAPMVFAHDPGSTVELMADVLTTSLTGDAHQGQVNYTQRATSQDSEAASPSIGSARRLSAEVAGPAIAEILIDDPTNFPASGGKVYLSFSSMIGNADNSRIIPTEVGSTLVRTPGQDRIPVPDSSVFPVSSASPFVVVFDPGGLKEERLLISGSAGNDLLITGSLLRFNHPLGTLVQHFPAKEELLTYTSVVGNNLSFSPSIVLQFTHSPEESAIVSVVDSFPSLDGYDFPFYLPPDLSFRLQSILDLVRAAGVQVKFIDQR